jgi:hypothetical protein
MDTGRARVEELSMKQPAYEKPEGSDAGVLLTAEEAVVEIEVANPELLLSDAELLIVEDEPLSAEELLTEEDGLLAAEEEILDAGVELLSVEEGMLTVEAKDELLLTTEDELEGVPEGDVAEGTDGRRAERLALACTVRRSTARACLRRSRRYWRNGRDQ